MQSSDIECEILFQTMETNVKTLNEFRAQSLIPFVAYHVDVDSCKCALSQWHVEEDSFFIVVSLAQQILGIPTSQIKTKRIFSIVEVFTRFHRC